MEMVPNPWEVDFFQDFQFYNCPACKHIEKEEDAFVNHVRNSHEESKTTIFFKEDTFEDSDVIEVPEYRKLCKFFVEGLTKHCDRCDIGFETFFEFQEHVRFKHHSELVFGCDIETCVFKCDSHMKLRSHLLDGSCPLQPESVISEKAEISTQTDETSFTSKNDEFYQSVARKRKMDTGEPPTKKVIISSGGTKKAFLLGPVVGETSIPNVTHRIPIMTQSKPIVTLSNPIVTQSNPIVTQSIESVTPSNFTDTEQELVKETNQIDMEASDVLSENDYLNQPPKLKCYLCPNQSFANRIEYRRHLLVKHPIGNEDTMELVEFPDDIEPIFEANENQDPVSEMIESIIGQAELKEFARNVLSEHDYLKQPPKLECYLCPNQSLANRIEQRRHLFFKHPKRCLLKNKEGSYDGVCYICGAKTFSDYQMHLDHMLIAHKKDMEFSCKFCTFKANTYSKLKLHKQTNHVGPNWNDFKYCMECDYFGQDLTQHTEKYGHTLFVKDYKRSHTNTMEKYGIPKEKRLNQKTELLKKVIKIQDQLSEDPNVQCAACGQVFQGLQNVRKHILENHKLNEYQCYTCGQIFNGLADVEKHIVDHHFPHIRGDMFGNPRSSEWQCQECQFICHSEATLGYHLCHEYPIQWTDVNPSSWVPKKCKDCPESFTDFDSYLIHHVKVHSKKFQCTYPGCNLTFESAKSLEHHTSKSTYKHKTLKIPGGVKCDKCDFVTSCQLHLDRHIRLNHKVGTDDWNTLVPCEKCGKFVKKKVLKHHNPKTCGNSRKTFRCELCDFKSSLREEISKHRNECHPLNLSCDYCPKKFRVQDRKDLHVESEHEKSNTREHKCHLCDLSFSSLKNLRFHQNDRHKRYHMCSLCESLHTDKEKMRYHLMVVHEIGTNIDFLFVCPTCHSCHKTSQELSDHMVDKHDMKLDHPCNQCGKVLPSELILKHHKLEEHSFNPFKSDGEDLLNQKVVSEDVKAFKCDFCDKRYKSSRTLDMHQKQEHKTAPHNHKCDQCDYTTWEKAKLRKHFNEVHNKNPYKCSICKKVFETFNKCSKHKNEEHYKKKLFSCSVCKKECKAQIDLAEHMLDEHQIIYKYL